jgi:hypothetical protein
MGALLAFLALPILLYNNVGSSSFHSRSHIFEECPPGVTCVKISYDLTLKFSFWKLNMEHFLFLLLLV